MERIVRPLSLHHRLIGKFFSLALKLKHAVDVVYCSNTIKHENKQSPLFTSKHSTVTVLTVVGEHYSKKVLNITFTCCETMCYI